MKTQIGLGVLSIPAAFDTLGLVPGIICLCAIAFITTWSDYMVGAFKLHHRDVYSIADVGGLIFGRWGRWFLGAAFCLCMSNVEPPHKSPANNHRLGLRGWVWDAQYFHRVECSLNTRCLHCSLRRRRCDYHVWFGKHSNTW